MDNYYKNLEWVTHQENIIHASKNGLLHPANGLSHCCSKFSKNDIKYIRSHYIPNDYKYGVRALAKKFNCSHVAVLKIIHNKTYTNI